MTTYITTDTHFGHKAMIEYCGRPADFTDKIIRAWKAQVKPEDTVIHLGDVSWPDYYEVLKDLPGHKILVKGNHDKKSDNWYMTHGFEFVCTSFSKRINGIDILFTHEPDVFHNHDVNIHGHLHQSAEVQSDCCLYKFALEDWGYANMISLDAVMKQVEDLWRTFQNDVQPKINHTKDMVNRPDHYVRNGEQCINAMVREKGLTKVLAFCECNTFKYNWRAPFKGKEEEDHEKAHRYEEIQEELSQKGYID